MSINGASYNMVFINWIFNEDINIELFVYFSSLLAVKVILKMMAPSLVLIKY